MFVGQLGDGVACHKLTYLTVPCSQCLSGRGWQSQCCGFFLKAFFVILQRSVSINKNSCSITDFVVSVSKDLCNWKQ